ncbi:N-acetylglucosaminyl transferase component Gpi1 [Nitzschia inconspicua]|uniref:N-acetylglucosaminyl transferase component Gpi1 n=1 Tax=Nitzschia inconspicua TaxID=303405 RepID=A0A9K3PN10_9STRA|nr:N-acetylglucosaminyl transferase component Gpi1 [Nitzschia inconspicua]
MTEDGSSSIRSRVLVLPSKRRQRQHVHRPSGWVLGWKIQRDKDKETILVASFLPPGISLTTYQERIAKWQQEQALSPQECTCLTDSLEIVAYWENDSSSIATNVTATLKASMPIIDSCRGYPWWKGDDNDNNIHNARRKHNQLLFYSLDKTTYTGSYLVSQLGYQTDWALLLHRINHCRQVEIIILSDTIPSSPIPSLSSKMVVTAETKSAGTASTSEFTIEESSFEKVKRRLLYNSLTFLHWRQCWKDSNCIPLLRCLRAFHSFAIDLSTEYPNSAFCCSCCDKPCRIPEQSKLTCIRAARLDTFLSSLLDTLLGLMVCAVLVYTLQNAPHVGTFYLNVRLHAFQVLQDQIGWLETFPAGFKLNVPLTQNMGYEIHNVLHHQGRFLSATLWNPHFCSQYGVPLLAAVSALGGWSTFLAIVVDVWRIENLHLMVMTICFRKLYQAELYLLSALFRLFRGKKRNILRQRTDSMDYDAMQLLVGTIAFCICVFLWTTLFVYYTFFVLWNWLMNLPVLTVWVAYTMSRSFPWGSLWYRLLHPGWFPQDSYLQFLPAPDASPCIQIAVLRPINRSTASIISSHIADPLRKALLWYLRLFLEVFFPHSSNSSPISLPLEAELISESL